MLALMAVAAVVTMGLAGSWARSVRLFLVTDIDTDVHWELYRPGGQVRTAGPASAWPMGRRDG